MLRIKTDLHQNGFTLESGVKSRFGLFFTAVFALVFTLHLLGIFFWRLSWSKRPLEFKTLTTWRVIAPRSNANASEFRACFENFAQEDKKRASQHFCSNEIEIYSNWELEPNLNPTFHLKRGLRQEKRRLK